jgi:hypothetical protein
MPSEQVKRIAELFVEYPADLLAAEGEIVVRAINCGPFKQLMIPCPG